MPRGVPIPPTKMIPCRKCSKPMQVGHKTRIAKLCIDCSVSAVVDNIDQLKKRNGPNYEKWRANLLRSMERDFRGSGTPVENDNGEREGSR